MGLFSSVTGGIGAVTGGLGGVVGSVVNPLQAAMVGEQYRPERINIDPESYRNKYFDQEYGQLSDVAKEAQQRQISADVRARQMGLADMLQAQAEGRGPSVAELQAQRMSDTLAAQQAGAAASQRGVNSALAARLAGQNAAQIGLQGQQQIAELRANEMLQGRNALASALQSTRGQDIGTAQTNDQLLMQALGQRSQMSENERRAQMQRQQDQMTAQNAYQQQTGEAQARQIRDRQNFYSGIAQAAAGGASNLNLGGR